MRFPLDRARYLSRVVPMNTATIQTVGTEFVYDGDTYTVVSAPGALHGLYTVRMHRTGETHTFPGALFAYPELTHILGK